MRRTTLALLRCPRCRVARLAAEGVAERIRFGPVHCGNCGAVHPIAEGILDLGVGEVRRSAAQRLLESRVVARSYERGLRRLVAALDPESEWVLLRALFAPAPGENVLDLSCGTAQHAGRLAEEQPEVRVVGLDRSAPMLQEAAHHLMETRAQVDLVRGDAVELPFADGILDGVLNVASLHLYADPGAVLRQVARALRPGGRLVGSTLLPEKLRPLDRLEARAGVHRRGEEELRALCAAAELVAFERVIVRPWIFFRVERAAGA